MARKSQLAYEKEETQERRRDSLEIVKDMLEVGMKAVPKTRYMYGANLSYAQLKAYFSKLIDPSVTPEMLFVGKKRRSGILINLIVLEYTRSTIGKTALIFKAKLSFAKINECLDYLIRRGLVEEYVDKKKDLKFYTITDRGRSCINVYINLKKLMPPRSTEALLKKLNGTKYPKYKISKKGFEALRYIKQLITLLKPSNTSGGGRGGGGYVADLYF